MNGRNYPKCNESAPYEINLIVNSSAFVCSCGYKYFDKSIEETIDIWWMKKPDFTQLNELLKRKINEKSVVIAPHIKIYTKSSLSNTLNEITQKVVLECIYGERPCANYTFKLREDADLLSNRNAKYTTEDILNIYGLAVNIAGRRIRRKYYLTKHAIRFHAKYASEDLNPLRGLYQSEEAKESHRKKGLIKYMCPNAFSYLLWKRAVLGLGDISIVDTSYAKNLSLHPYSRVVFAKPIFLRR